jgi:hypothetical protein
MGNSKTSADVRVAGITTSAQVTLETALPSGKTIAELNSSYNVFTFRLDVTSSSGASMVSKSENVNWMISDNTTASCTGTLSQFGSYLLNDTLNYSFTETIPEVTTGPAVVRIYGTERVGKTLEAKLYKSDGTRFTASSGVTYEWYRLNHRSESIIGKSILGHHDTYDLDGSDRDYYIRLVVKYNGITYTDVTGDIDSRYSDSGSSHSVSINDSSDDNGSTVNYQENQPSIIYGEDGRLKIIENGNPVVGWKLINGQWYYGDGAGVVQTGWRFLNGSWYYLRYDGVMTTGWQIWNGKWYLLGNDGNMLTDWQRQGGTWYLLNNDGSMLTGWQLVYGKWYYLDPNGAMTTGWQKWNGKWYYLYGDGSMASNTFINGYRVGSTGAWIS